jgi:hypothetical protein
LYLILSLALTKQLQTFLVYLVLNLIITLKSWWIGFESGELLLKICVRL